MKVAVTAQDAKGDFHFDSSGPWSEFKAALLGDGNRIVRISENPDAIVCNNYSPSLSPYLRKIPRNKRAIIFWESPTSMPQMFSPRVMNLFKFRFFPSPAWASRYVGEYFRWPQNIEHQLNNETWDLRSSQFCVITSEQFSFVESELYSLRRRVIRNCFPLIDLYGYGWDRSKLFKSSRILRGVVKGLQSQKFKLRQLDWRLNTPGNYKGTIMNKTDVLQKYKFALVIENNLEYVTEKVFDAILNGCVTVYVGPSLESFGIPEDICVVANNDLENLVDVLNSLPRDLKRISSVRESINQFIGSKEFLQHHNSLILGNLGKRISEQLGSQRD